MTCRVHNEVETIENMAQKIEALVPEARVEVAHGQMREKELERVMRDFYQVKRTATTDCTPQPQPPRSQPCPWRPR